MSNHAKSETIGPLLARVRKFARAIASQVIWENRDEWHDLKEHIRAGHGVGYGGYVQTRFSGLATAAAMNVEETCREGLERETGRPFAEAALPLLVNAACGEIYARACRVATRTKI